MYDIPLFDLNYDEKEEEAVLAVIRSKWISSGPKCTELENKFSEMLNVTHAVALTNCTATLHLALLALGIGEGDEVIVPSMTFVATVNAVRYVGAKPVFCDIESCERITIDPIEIEKLISEKTKAIIVMHYAGFSCNMDAIMDIATRHGIKVVEDACHGPLSEYHGKKLGTIGDVGCFSFFSNKNISTGEGGILVTNNNELLKKVMLLKSHGMTTLSYERSKGHSTSYDVVELGYNYRMDDMRAAIAIEQLDKLEKDIFRRMEIRKKYISLLEWEEHLLIPFKDREEFSSSYIFPIVLRDADANIRDEIRKFLMKNGIQTSVHYPPAHRFKIYENCVGGKLPNTEYVADCEITLPMYGNLLDDQVEYICTVLKKGISVYMEK